MMPKLFKMLEQLDHLVYRARSLLAKSRDSESLDTGEALEIIEALAKLFE